MHVLSDANGLPLRVGLPAANTYDSLALKPMLSHVHMGHESHANDSRPGRLHADKTYDTLHLRRWLWGKHIGLRIARKGIESSERLGRPRWVIERTMSWLTDYRPLNHRHERAHAERHRGAWRAGRRGGGLARLRAAAGLAAAARGRWTGSGTAASSRTWSTPMAACLRSSSGCCDGDARNWLRERRVTLPVSPARRSLHAVRRGPPGCTRRARPCRHGRPRTIGRIPV